MLKKILLSVYLLASVAFLFYLLLPGPSKISDFPALPDSVKSSLEGDTVQVPNIAAYYSDNYRDFVISYYREAFTLISKFPFPALRLNYPPEDAFTYIKDQTQSTYLEEITYPFRESLFISGLEPLDKDGKPRYLGGDSFLVDGSRYRTKVTIRYFPSPLIARLAVWLGINTSFALLAFVGRRIIKNA